MITSTLDVFRGELSFPQDKRLLLLGYFRGFLGPHRVCDKLPGMLGKFRGAGAVDLFNRVIQSHLPHLERYNFGCRESSAQERCVESTNAVLDPRPRLNNNTRMLILMLLDSETRLVDAYIHK